MSTRCLIVGCGRSGAHAATVLRRSHPDMELVLCDRNVRRAQALAKTCGAPVEVVAKPNLVGTDCVGAALFGADIVVAALPQGAHVDIARMALAADVPFVAAADHPDEVWMLMEMADSWDRTGAFVPAAGMSPGLSGLLVRHASTSFERVDEIHIAKAGTGGPACARAHHRALKDWGTDWRDGAMVVRRSGSGRQLAHFPSPIGPRDCYRAALSEVFLLQPLYPDATRITARLAATRRDRLTAHLPMLRPPHEDGGPGGVRVEVWGRRDGATDALVLAATGSPAGMAGAVAAITVQWILDGRWPAGARGVGEVIDTSGFIADLESEGIRIAIYEGAM